MKSFSFIFFLSGCLLCTGTVHAQKAKLVTAWNHLKYDELDQAKEVIDQAAQHEVTKELAKTWYYRGLIYQAMYKHRTFSNLDSNPPSVAFLSYQKALEIEPKGEFTEDINTRIGVVAFFKGVEEYKKKDFASSFNSFEFVTKRNSQDTLALLYTAYSADYAGNVEAAIRYYKKLIEINYRDLEPGKTNIYLEMALLHKRNLKDTTKALEYILAGRKIYPEINNLLREEANIYLQTGKTEEAIASLETTINKTPDDTTLYLVLGQTYNDVATVAFKAKNQEKANEYFTKAETTYKKLLTLNPSSFDAAYAIGSMIFNLGAEMANAANEIKSDVEYNAAKAKADEKLKQALPYLEKAFELNPTDIGTLTSLKQLYVRMGNTEKYNMIKAVLDKLQ